MRTKSKYPKTMITLRIRPEQLEKVDKIAENKRVERSELLRKVIDNYIATYETGL